MIRLELGKLIIEENNKTIKKFGDQLQQQSKDFNEPLQFMSIKVQSLMMNKNNNATTSTANDSNNAVHCVEFYKFGH